RRRCLRFAKATPTREAEGAAAVDAKRLTDEETMDGTGAEPRFRLLIKSAARKLRVGRGVAAPLNERFSCLSVKPLGGLDGANSAERGLSSFWTRDGAPVYQYSEPFFPRHRQRHGPRHEPSRLSGPDP